VTKTGSLICVDHLVLFGW